jgi:hypothetical protein
MSFDYRQRPTWEEKVLWGGIGMMVVYILYQMGWGK